MTKEPLSDTIPKSRVLFLVLMTKLLYVKLKLDIVCSQVFCEACYAARIQVKIK